MLNNVHMDFAEQFYSTDDYISNESKKKSCNLPFMKSAKMRSFSGPYFPLFGPNTEIFSLNLSIRYECEKIGTRKIPNLDIFNAVLICCYMRVVNLELTTDVSATSIILAL